MHITRYIRNTKTLARAVLTTVIGMSLASCSTAEEPDSHATEGNFSLSLQIEVDDASMRCVSRALPDDGSYTPGNAFENYISLGAGDNRPDLRIYLVDEVTDEIIHEFVDMKVRIAAVADDYRRYALDLYVDGALYPLLNGRSVKVLMLANWRRYPAGTVGRNLDEMLHDTSAEFIYTPFTELSEENRIPMFGIRRYEGIRLEDGVTYNLGTLHLLRAFAKVEVTDRNAMEGRKQRISAVSMERYTDRSAMAPYGVRDHGDYATGSWQTDFGKVVSIPASAKVIEQQIPFAANRADKYSYIIYVPEYDNTDTDTNPARIAVRYNDGETFYVDFKNYGSVPGLKEGEIFDLRRNNHYHYRVRRAPYDVEVELDIQPYSSVEIDAPLGLPLDETGDLMVYLEKDSDGNLKVPVDFQKYLDKYGKELPEWKYEDELGDYYAVHYTTDGTMANAEIWLKDNAGCRVNSNFVSIDLNDSNCSTRSVTQFNETTQTDYRKDRDGDRRLQHNSDHSSIVYAPNSAITYKNADNSLRLPVESWDRESGKFYITTESPTHYIFREYDNTGQPTGKEARINKTTGDREDL
ncbi:MAG: hypothetical protein K2L55_04675 [Muribaculaceae bacterium]|nr:hypothetical protein [Muribaculaceae bacterium]